MPLEILSHDTKKVSYDSVCETCSGKQQVFMGLLGALWKVFWVPSWVFLPSIYIYIIDPQKPIVDKNPQKPIVDKNQRN